jgi:hypothetical protein
MYKTAEGAWLVINKYSTCSDPDSGYVEQEPIATFGDFTRTCTSKEMQSGGEYRVWYRIEFVYRNYYHALVGFGWESDIRPGFIEDIAEILLATLQAAPLSDTVTWTP